MNYIRISAGCYQSKDGRIEINQLPDGHWAWAVDGVGYDADSTLKAAKSAAEKAASK
jgi:hypothetical protein